MLISSRLRALLYYLLTRLMLAPLLLWAIALFEDEAEAKKWLSKSKVNLDNQTPLEAITTDAGSKKVEQILYRAEYGVYG